MKLTSAILVLLTLFTSQSVMAQSSTDKCAADYYEQLTALIDAEADFADIAELASEAEAECTVEAAVTDADGVLYRVSVNRAVNLRAGAGTNHDRVGQAQPGDIYEVFSEQEGGQYNWLEIRYRGETAFIAESLTIRLPDVVLVEGGLHIVPGINCRMAYDKQRDTRMRIYFAFSGENMSGVEADLYRPNEDRPALISNTRWGSFAGDPNSSVLYQYYAQWFSDGVYTIEVNQGRISHRVGVDMRGKYIHWITLRCD